MTLLVGPRPPSLADRPASADTGDPALAARVREVFGDGGQRGVAVALVGADGRATFAGVGGSGDPGRPAVDQDTRFEIGSVTKGLTGMLIAVLLARITGGDPCSGDAADVLATARDQDPQGGAEPSCSNLGAAAAGDLVAQEAGTTYPALLRERVLDPLGTDATTVVTDPARLPSPRARGTTASGREQAPWVAPGWAPAGTGTWSTTTDMARLVAALADGRAPGVEAVRPREAFTGDRRIRLFWITSPVRGRTVTWHNGGTGGFSSFVGFEPATGRGVVVLANTDAGVDRQAVELLLDGAS